MKRSTVVFSHMTQLASSMAVVLVWTVDFDSSIGAVFPSE